MATTLAEPLFEAERSLESEFVFEPSPTPAVRSPLPAFEGGRDRTRRRRSRLPRSARRLLPKTPALFPWLERRFAPGEATLWAGPSSEIERMLEILYAGCAQANGRISLLEGANRFHPYRLGERGRGLGVDPGELLERIRLARAFTIYQLVALVDGWSQEARREHPTLLVAHDLPALFESEEAPADERAPLLRHVAATLRDLVEETALPLLITSPGGIAGFPGLDDRGPRLFDYVRFRPRPTALVLEAYREAATLRFVPRAPGQLGLEAFLPNPQEEVVPWGVPPRRTGRRSKSG